MAKAFQKIYTKITAITKATCSLKAEGVGNDELATVNGKLAQVVKIMGDDVTLQVFQGTEGIPTNAEVVFLGKAPSLKVSDQLAGRFFNAYGDPIDGGPAVEGEEVEIGGPSVNPVRRKQPSELIATGIAGIDQQLYEAATVDGAGRFQKIWHITIPELFPTYIVLLILSVSNLLSNGMDQYLVFKNPTNKNPIEVLDLYVYQLSFGQTANSNIPFSTVVSMFKSLVSVVLLFITNKISKWIRGSSIF